MQLFKYFRKFKIKPELPAASYQAMIKLLIPVIFFMISLRIAEAQFYQGYQMTFGKNRVQYEPPLWTFYRLQNFDTYYYLGGEELALFTARNADKHLAEIEKTLDYRLEGRIKFVIYNKLAERKQSNIGLEGDEGQNNTGGLTRIVGNSIMLYFNGSYRDFEHQIRAGIAQILIDQLMYGGDFKDRLQNAVLLTLPVWYQQGLVSYISRSWDIDVDNHLRDGILSGRFKKFNRLSGNDAVVAGHSFWRYIAEIHGESSIANLLYLSRINRNINTGFLFVLGSSLKNLSKQWLEYYQKYYFNGDDKRDPLTAKPVGKKSKQDQVFTQLKLNPAGTKVAYVSNELGKYKCRVVNISNNKIKKITKGGYKSLSEKPDYSQPLLAWHPSGRILTLIREKKGRPYMFFYNTDKRKPEKTPLFYFEKILDFAYSPDGQDLVISATIKGQSDIFIYNLRTRTFEQVTNDFYDDLNPRFINNAEDIIFSSNRVIDTLGVDKKNDPPQGNNYDIFIYNRSGKSQILRRVTDTPYADETNPIPYSDKFFSYVSDGTGIRNRYAANLDSVISFIDTTEHYRYIIDTHIQTNYARSIIDHDISSEGSHYGMIVFQKGRNRMYLESKSPVVTEVKATPVITPYQKQRSKPRTVQPDKVVIPVKQSVFGNDTIVHETRPLPSDTTKIDIDNYVFQSEEIRTRSKKQEAKKKALVSDDSLKVTNDVPEVTQIDNLPKKRNYELRFEPNYLLSQLDNSLLSNTYQAFTGGAFYFDPGLNGLFKIGISDLLQDYKLTGGFRLSTDLRSNEYLISYENLKNRVDKQISFFRQGRTQSTSQSFLRVHTHELKYTSRLPLSNILSLRGSIAYRNDRVAYQSTDLKNLQLPSTFDHWASAKAEIVYDNTIQTGLNLYNGLRYKVFAETFREIDKEKSGLYVIGADFRHYKKIHRSIIWANRFAISTSFGDRKLVYYMGSTDNALLPAKNFDENISIDFSQNYAFQAVATNMRGFVQNIRNGNSFALINSEFRIPIIQYLANKPVKSDFLNNFQIVTFGDVGTAWTGSSPYADDNSLNQQVIITNPITITVNRQTEPIVAGYGFGLRSRLFGYFVRADYAWGVEDRIIRDPVFYVSLSLDF
jgi:Tol biopolymer transport system component